MSTEKDIREATALIFDLGGVIIDIEPEYTLRQLTMLPHTRRERLDMKSLAHLSFRLETGLTDEDTFRDELRNILKTSVPNEAIDDAWNGMLLTIDPAKIALLEDLREQYDLYLLSNTNPIHLREVHNRLQAAGTYRNFDQLFTECYYSHLEGLKKPNPELFRHVIVKNKLDADTTFFLDDLAENLSGAAEAGLQVSHVNTPDHLFQLFSYEPQS
ncbi:MAG: HAD family phosphatase [Cyclobacteriaceae bacterium]